MQKKYRILQMNQLVIKMTCERNYIYNIILTIRSEIAKTHPLRNPTPRIGQAIEFALKYEFAHAVQYFFCHVRRFVIP